MDFLRTIADRWDQFMAFELSSEILIVLGGLLVFIGVMKIIGMGLKMLFWVILVTIGGASVAYGLDRTSIEFPSNLKDELKNLAGPGGQLSMQAVELLCNKIENGTVELAPE